MLGLPSARSGVSKAPIKSEQKQPRSVTWRKPERQVMLDLQMKINQITYIPITAEMAAILENQFHPKMKVERVSIVSENGNFALAFESSSNALQKVEAKEAIAPAPKLEPRRKAPDANYVCVYGVDSDNIPRLITTHWTQEVADLFVKNFFDYDSKQPEKPGKYTKKQYNKWHTALKRWEKLHPAGDHRYMHYFTLPKAATAKGPLVFVVGVKECGERTVIYTTESKADAVAFKDRCVAYDKGPCAKNGHDKITLADRMAWRQQHPAKCADYREYIVTSVAQA